MCFDYLQKLQIETVSNTEEGKWLNSHLNLLTIVASKVLNGAFKWKRTASIQELYEKQNTTCQRYQKVSKIKST